MFGDKKSVNPRKAISRVKGFLVAGVLVLAGCSSAVSSSGPLALNSVDPDAISPTELDTIDRKSSQDTEYSKLEIPAQLIPSGSSVTISGFPVAELETVRRHYSTLHSSVILVNDELASGTAWLVRPDLAVTVEHGIPLLSNTSSIRMKLPDGSSIRGSLVKESKKYDLALIKLDEPIDRPPLVLSDRAAQVGEPLFSIGHPGVYLGGYNTAWITTIGVMGGYQSSPTSFVRTTIPSLGGQSGSPIFNLDGEVVAVNGLCSFPQFGPGESLRGVAGDQISYMAPREECGGADVSVIKWILDQYDRGLTDETMPGWPDFREEEWVSLADQQVPQQFVGTGAETTVSGFPLASQEIVKGWYEKHKKSVLLMDIGNVDSKSGGTGWLVGPDLVLTNEHVLPRADEDLPIRVETFDGSFIGATEVARDAELDIALVRLNRPLDAPPLVLSSSSTSAGEPVFAIGHPSNIPRTWVTTIGVVASREEIAVMYSTIPNYYGSSGSPVFNLDGEVVGIMWGNRSMPIGASVEPASSDLQISYHPPLPITASTPAREIQHFLNQFG